MSDRHLEFFLKKKIKVLEYGFMLIFNINEPGVVSFMYKVTNYVRTQCGCFRHKFNSCVQGFETPRKRL